MSTKIAQTPLPHSPNNLASKNKKGEGYSVGEGTPVVLADFHHAGLLNSLIMLFEGRLNGVLYRPIGTDWFTNGYWKVYDHPATVAQFLGIGSASPDGTPPLNNVESTAKTFLLPDPIYLCEDIESGRSNKALTFNNFMLTHVDFLVASIPQHVEPFLRLSELHPSRPNVVFQIGNNWDIAGTHAKNIMSSAKIDKSLLDGKNYVEYHQEFDVNRFLKKSNQSTKITSFVNMFGVASHLIEDYNTMVKVEAIMSDWEFKVYGGQCRDGVVSPTGVASEMLSSMFVWHTKQGGDGYGHVIHNAFCAGRPPIVKISQYLGKMAGDLMVDGVTCIDIDGLDPHQIALKIGHFSQPKQYKALSKAASQVFKEKVNFDKESMLIKSFLDNAL